MKVFAQRCRVTPVLLRVLLLALSACSGSGPGGPGATRTVRILLGHLRFAPAALTVQVGTTVHFVLQNSDGIDHEFVLGTETVQQQHERDRMMNGGHMMEGAGMMAVGADKTVDLSYTFSSPGRLIYGCHVDDHYSQGMRGVVTVSA